MRLSIHVQEFRIITPSLEPKCCATSNPRDRNSECTALAIFFSQFLWNAKCFTSVLTRSVRRNSDKCAQENCSNSSPHPRIMHANRREWVPQGTEPFAVSSTTGSATFVFRASRWVFDDQAGVSMVRLRNADIQQLDNGAPPNGQPVSTEARKPTPTANPTQYQMRQSHE